MTHAIRIGSLFSGMGGLDLAVESVTGAQPAWFCEWEDAPSKVLARHYPDVPNHRDVTAVDWEQVEPVDIITGGSPCQDLSTAGKRAGMTEGTRSNLWVNMREAIATIRPRLVVWENVQGALSAEATSDSDVEPGTGLLGGGGGHLRALGRVLGDLAEIGYDAAWTTVRASDVGAPHHRARVFLIATTAHPGRERHGECIQSDHLGRVDGADEGQTRKWEWARQVSQYRGPAHVIDGPRPLLADSYGIGVEAGEQSVAGPPPQPGVDDSERALPHAGGEERSRGAGLRESSTGEVGRGRPGDMRDEAIDWGPYAPAVRRWERLTRHAPAPTELNKNGNPRLNAAFAEWMMGLPAGWVTDTPDISRADQLKAIGNGVCPPQAAAALLQLLEIMDEQEMVTSHDPR